MRVVPDDVGDHLVTTRCSGPAASTGVGCGVLVDPPPPPEPPLDEPPDEPPEPEPPPEPLLDDGAARGGRRAARARAGDVAGRHPGHVLALRAAAASSPVALACRGCWRRPWCRWSSGAVVASCSDAACWPEAMPHQPAGQGERADPDGAGQTGDRLAVPVAGPPVVASCRPRSPGRAQGRVIATSKEPQGPRSMGLDQPLTSAQPADNAGRGTLAA